MKTDNRTLAGAMRILSREIQSQDGVANVSIAEAACRIEELAQENAELKQWLKFDPEDKSTWPSAYEEVLIFSREFGLCVAKFATKESYFIERGTYQTMTWQSVTHWQPIPEPPAGKN